MTDEAVPVEELPLEEPGSGPQGPMPPDCAVPIEVAFPEPPAPVQSLEQVAFDALCAANVPAAAAGAGVFVIVFSPNGGYRWASSPLRPETAISALFRMATELAIKNAGP